jgi:hypothetical protein
MWFLVQLHRASEAEFLNRFRQAWATASLELLDPGIKVGPPDEDLFANAIARQSLTRWPVEIGPERAGAEAAVAGERSEAKVGVEAGRQDDLLGKDAPDLDWLAALTPHIDLYQLDTSNPFDEAGDKTRLGATELRFCRLND